MKKIIMIFASFMLLFLCGCSNQNKEDVKDKTKVESVVKMPILKVYNMGNVPEKQVNNLVERLKPVYPQTVFAGNLPMVDSAYIKGDVKGNNRYWFSKLFSYANKKMDPKKEIILIIENGEVCNWTKNGSHATLGISTIGGHVSFVSYQRLKVNKLNTTDNMLKVSMHELGHSVAGLVRENKSLRCHCSDKNCLMRDANNKYPYRNITHFCDRCDKAMKAKGFKTENLNL